MKYPEIRFRDSFLLVGAIYDDIEPSYMPPITKSDERHLLSREYINNKTAAYKEAWDPYQGKILQGICQLLNMEFRQNIIDVYTASFRRSFSFPLLIATKYEPNRAIEVIAHELIHVLLYDNTSSKLDLYEAEQTWRKLFPDVENVTTLLHIPVHAVLQALFDDILNEPERTLNDKKVCEDDLYYKLAWDYVERVGYKTIIDKLIIS